MYRYQLISELAQDALAEEQAWFWCQVAIAALLTVVGKNIDADSGWCSNEDIVQILERRYL